MFERARWLKPFRYMPSPIIMRRKFEMENKTNNIRVLLFGAFRQYAADGAINVVFPEGGSVADLRESLASELKRLSPEFSEDLLYSSAIGNNDEILSEDFQLWKECELAILPPVCGG